MGRQWGVATIHAATNTWVAGVIWPAGVQRLGFISTTIWGCPTAQLECNQAGGHLWMPSMCHRMAHSSSSM
jgi:hypothetical protein